MLASRTLFRGRRYKFPLSRYLRSSSVKESHAESGDLDVMMLRGLKGKESRHRRTLQLRKNRHDAELEKKARTGQCKQHSSQLFNVLKQTQNIEEPEWSGDGATTTYIIICICRIRC